MKTIFTLVLFYISLGTFAGAQSWMALEQPPLRLKYEIPYNWYVGGYMTSRSCNCTSGTINTAPSRDLNMVIFYSDEYDVDSLQDQEVWGYRFNPPSITDTIETENFQFEVARSRWENDSEVLVMRLSAEMEGNSYVIYFWGPDATISTMEETILHIVESLEMIS